jgi:hypothetical protein
VNDDDLQISDPAEIAEVHQFGSYPEFLQHDSVQKWSSPRSYATLWGATREGEMRGREVGHMEERRDPNSWEFCVLLLPLGPGRGQAYPHQGT